jgi:chromate transporter
MTLTILLMAFGTGMLALTPGYDTIGIAAPILLVLARLIRANFGGSGLSLLAAAVILGIMVLPIMILLVFALLYDQFGQLPAVSVALTGAGAAAAGMVLATGLKMAIKVKLDIAGWLIVGCAILGILIFRMPMVYVVLAIIPTALVLTAWLGKK